MLTPLPHMLKPRFACLCAALLFCLPPAGQCVEAADQDNVISTIKEALQQYEKGDYTSAASNLNYASQLVLQKKSEQMRALLPEAPPGWETEKTKSQAVGAEMLGGGITISRTYSKGEATVHLEVIADSPMMRSVLMMTSNSVFASAGGGKLEKVKGNRAIVKYDGDDQKGDIYVVVDSRFVVTIKGRHVQREDLELFASIMDYDRLLKN